MKQRLSLYVSIFSGMVLLTASIALYLMLYHSAFEWYIAGPLMFTAGDRASELVKDIRKVKKE